MEVVHIEGDSDNPVNRGTLCPKGAAAIDYVRSPARVKHPMYRKPGADRLRGGHLGLRDGAHRAR